MDIAGNLITISPYWALVLIGFLFILVFSALVLFRREGLSPQFVLESLIVIMTLVGGSWLLGYQLGPFPFLILLYAITMRSRLAIDLANMLLQRKRQDLALGMYGLALRWWPDTASRFRVLTNKGAAELYVGQVDQAIATLRGALETDPLPPFSQRYQAACRHTLGRALELQGDMDGALAEFTRASHVMPRSVYGQAARAALQRHKHALDHE